MKIPRSRRISAACALLVVAGGVTALALSGLETHWGTGSNPTPATNSSAPARAQVRAHESFDPKLGEGIALRLDDAISLSPPARSKPRTHDNSVADGVDAHAADDFVENDAAGGTLNLRVPDNIGISTGQVTKKRSGKSVRDGQTIEPRVALDTGTTAPPTPYVDTFKLFNPEYGLRGFMKRGWINQSVAFQGGVGLDDDRIDQSRDDDWRDNIAVGMGLIVAF